MTIQDPHFLNLHHRNTDPISIAYDYSPAKAHSATFMWFAGFKSDMASQKAQALAQWAKACDAGALLFDYSGHGQSEGRFEDGTISRWLDEAEAVYRHVVDQGAKEVVFVGSSMGGWIALLLAQRLQRAGLEAPKALVLIAPAWDMTRLMWEKASSEARDILINEGRYARPSAYSDDPYIITKALIDDGAQHLFAAPVSIPCPIRILQGVLDPDVPCTHTLDLLNVLSEPDCRITLIKDGEHRLSRPQDIALLFATCVEFLGG